MLIKYLILGLVQGFTEFLPVSSSGHLVIVQKFLALSENGCLLGVALHLGTLLALFVFFFKDIKKIINNVIARNPERERGMTKQSPYGKASHSQKKGLLRSLCSLAMTMWSKEESFRIIVYITVVTAITGVCGILGNNFIKGLFASPRKVYFMLIVTGIILLATKRFMNGERNFSELTIKDALWLGLTQSLALIPGISRSGITISTLLFRRVNKESAFRFSFLASMPVILGAFIFELGRLRHLSTPVIIYMLAGVLVAFLSGLFALKMLFAIIQKAKFSCFGYYCLALGLICLFIL